MNGTTITPENRERYRQNFSAVFSDFYLFDRLLGLDRSDFDPQTQDYVVRLQLDHKVQVQDGVLSTTALSQGQRKRLALLTAYLEDRPIYVFDEWASDQDPVFKEIFYSQLLPELKHRGKTVLVISHDDRYFDCADRIVKLDYGKVEYVKHLDI
jgi:putative pyoverdin transport system ATP-binding/permease protein